MGLARHGLPLAVRLSCVRSQRSEGGQAFWSGPIETSNDSRSFRVWSLELNRFLAVPFLLEDKLQRIGGAYELAELWQLRAYHGRDLSVRRGRWPAFRVQTAACGMAVANYW